MEITFAIWSVRWEGSLCPFLIHQRYLLTLFFETKTQNSSFTLSYDRLERQIEEMFPSKWVELKTQRQLPDPARVFTHNKHLNGCKGPADCNPSAGLKRSSSHTSLCAPLPLLA